jgi:uncharacterized protein YdcH (DUF465 family)
MTDAQFNQLLEKMSSVDARLSGLEKGQVRIEEHVASLDDRVGGVEVQLQAHDQQSKKQHTEIINHVLDTTEGNDKVYKKKLTDHEGRITRLEKHLHSA